MRDNSKQRGSVSATGIAGLAIIGFVALSGIGVIAEEVDREVNGDLGSVSHADCLLFGPMGRQFRMMPREQFQASALTTGVMARMARPNVVAGGSRTETFQDVTYTGIIDQQIFGKLKSAGVAPALGTTDLEFIRRVTLDLTGRVPTPARVTAFINDGSANKRAVLVDELW
jgi:Protein of unknown function (DUF1549)